MNKNDSGFSSPLAMTTIFSLSLIIISLAMLISTSEKRIKSYNKLINANSNAESLIREVGTQLQSFCNATCDYMDNDEIRFLQTLFPDNNLIISDVSTGINNDIINENLRNNPSLTTFLNLYGDEIQTSYGWINPIIADIQFVETLKASYNTDDLFPLINTMPPLNIFYMSYEFIELILSFYGFTDAESKARTIKENITTDTQLSDIAAILGVPSNHRIFNLLGTKTAFWNIKMETDMCYINAVFAAVPEKENSRNVEKYILVEKMVSYKGGVNGNTRQ
jgi:hypothetical protein